MYVVGTRRRQRVVEVRRLTDHVALDHGRQVATPAVTSVAGHRRVRPATDAAARGHRRQRAASAAAASQGGRCGRGLVTQLAQRDRRRRVADAHDRRKADALAAGRFGRVLRLHVEQSLGGIATATSDHVAAAAPQFDAVDERPHVLRAAVVAGMARKYRFGANQGVVARTRTVDAVVDPKFHPAVGRSREDAVWVWT